MAPATGHWDGLQQESQESQKLQALVSETWSRSAKSFTKQRRTGGGRLQPLQSNRGQMTDQCEFEELRHRLVAVLRARLAEAEDDEARQANWEATNWALAAGDLCPSCGKEAFQTLKGLCLPCVKNDQERAYQLARRLSLVQKRYPKLARGLRKRAAKASGAG